MNKLQILKAAKQVLWTGEEPWTGDFEQFICVAIDRVIKYKDGISINNGIELKNYITTLMGADINNREIITLETWLKLNHNIDYYKYPRSVMQEYRHRFMDHLIKEFENGHN